MEVDAAGERIAPVAERRRDPAGDRPDRGGRGGQRLAPFHPGPHRGEPFFDRAQQVAQDAERIVGGAERAAEDRAGDPPDPPPIARFRTRAGNRLIARSASGSTAACAPISSIAVCSEAIWPASSPVASRKLAFSIRSVAFGRRQVDTRARVLQRAPRATASAASDRQASTASVGRSEMVKRLTDREVRSATTME